MFRRMTRSRARGKKPEVELGSSPKKHGNGAKASAAAAAGGGASKNTTRTARAGKRSTRSRSRGATKRSTTAPSAPAATNVTSTAQGMLPRDVAAAGFEEHKQHAPPAAHQGRRSRRTRSTRAAAPAPAPTPVAAAAPPAPQLPAAAQPSPAQPPHVPRTQSQRRVTGNPGVRAPSTLEGSAVPRTIAAVQAEEADAPRSAGDEAVAKVVELTEEQLAAARARQKQYRALSKTWTPGMSIELEGFEEAKQGVAPPASHRASMPAPEPSPAVFPMRLAKKLSFSAALTPAAGLGATDGDDAGAGGEAGAGASAAEAQKKKKKPRKKQIQLPRAGLQVHLRIRPWEQPATAAAAGDQPRDGEEGEEGEPVPAIDVRGETEVVMTAPQQSAAFKAGDEGGAYTFTRVWDAKTDQEELFDNVMEPLVESCVTEGKNGLVFAYGMTNAGKTYTIMGEPSLESPRAGIVPRAVESVLEKVAAYNALSQEERAAGRVLPAHALADLRVTVSYLEIYNEQIFDLLAPLPKGVHAERQRLVLGPKKDRVVVKNLQEKRVANAAAGVALMQQGNKSRMAAETVLNSDSSRSHAVFTITLWRKVDDAVSEHGRHWARLSIVDLAGSERGTRTKNTGARLREAGSINNSVMLLMRCLQTMRINQKNGNDALRVPFRETKLTYLFKDSLVGGGSGNTAMILCACPNTDDYDETMHVVKYGAMVQDITVASTTAELRWHVNKTRLGTTYDVDGRRVGPEERKAAMQAAADERRRRKRTSDEAELPGDQDADAAARARKRGRKSKRPRARMSRRTTTKGSRKRSGAAAGARASRASRRRTTRAGGNARGSGSNGTAADRADADGAAADVEAAPEDSAVVPPGAEGLSGLSSAQLMSLVMQLQSDVAAADAEAAATEDRVRQEMAALVATRITELEEFHASKAAQQARQQADKLSALMELRNQRTATAKKSQARVAKRRLEGVAEAGISTALDFSDEAVAGTDAGAEPATVIGDASPDQASGDESDDGSGSEYDSESGSGSESDEDAEEVLEELRIQIHECEAEMDRMRRKHKEEVEALKKQVTDASRAAASKHKKDAAEAAAPGTPADSEASGAARRDSGGAAVEDDPALEASRAAAAAAAEELAAARAEVSELRRALDMSVEQVSALTAEKSDLESSLQAALQAAEDAVTRAEQAQAAIQTAVDEAKAAQADAFATQVQGMREAHCQELRNAVARAEQEATAAARAEAAKELQVALASQRAELEAAAAAEVQRVKQAVAAARTPTAGTPKRRRLTQFTNSDLRRSAQAVSSAAAAAEALGMRRGSYESTTRYRSSSSGSSSDGSDGSASGSPSTHSSASSGRRSVPRMAPLSPANSTANPPRKLDKMLQFAGSYKKAMMSSASGTPVSQRGGDGRDENHVPGSAARRPRTASRADSDANPSVGNPGSSSAASALQVHTSPPPVAPTSRGLHARARFLMNQFSPQRTRRQRTVPKRYTPSRA